MAGMAALALLFAAACMSRPTPSSGPRPIQLSPCGRAFVFVDHGRPAATIVIPEGAGETERRAAEILRTSILKMSGVDLPVREARQPGGPAVAAIGFPPEALPQTVAPSLRAMRADGFVATTSTGNLYVCGGGKGVIYGVIHLLEKYYGCRRYSPTVEVFPKRDDLYLGCLLEVDNPVNEVRIVNGEFALDPDYRDWMRLHDPRDLYGAGYYVHTFQRLVPWQAYFEAHPEYFALMNGKRIIDQPCLTRPEVFDIAIARLREEMAAQPDKKIWSVSQNDNSSYCQCPECLKVIEEEGSPAGPIIRFVNRIAALFPDKTISTLAYQYSRPAPRLARPVPNVEVMLCTIELNRSRPIAEDPSSASFVRDIEDWGRICGNIYLWDYTVNFSHHVSPFPNLHVLGPNIRFFVDHGVRKHFQQTNTSPGHEWSELKSYLLARLLWDPRADVDDVMDDFLDGYYGPAGPILRRYIEALRGALERSGARLDIYEPPAVHAATHLSAADVALYDKLFDKAEAAAAGDREILTRVKTARLPLMYAKIETGKDDMFGPRGFYAEKGDRFEARPAMVRLLEEFASRCRAGGVRTLNESGLTPAAFTDSVKRFIDVQVEGNLAFRRPVAADPPPASKYARGDLAVLTNGVRGAADFKVHWLGWEGVDFALTLDLGRPVPAREITVSTLSDTRSWILHPESVNCSVSADGTTFREVGTSANAGDHQGEEVVRAFTWTDDPKSPGSFGPIRYVRFRIEGTKRLPAWHASAGGLSWVFVDEIVVR
ncbi:MAG: hypothetical protein A2W03_03965 [Candidatus Aminicenantes bacterium RBG_16_63_16]|nr:MAG: hypothetical protein A2W03_03965 [Candidatus Aminicenantes bacterium RBG_16_63_16]